MGCSTSTPSLPLGNKNNIINSNINNTPARNSSKIDSSHVLDESIERMISSCAATPFASKIHHNDHIIEIESGGGDSDSESDTDADVYPSDITLKGSSMPNEKANASTDGVDNKVATGISYSRNSSSAENASLIRVVSYNIRCINNKKDGDNIWENRKELFFESIAFLNADIFGFQEVCPKQYDEIVSRLSEFYEISGVARDDGKRKGEFCCIAYSKAKFTSVDSGTFWLSESPSMPSRGWDAALNRICTWARLRKKDGREFIFANTHFDHKGAIAKQESAELVSARVMTLCENAALPAILTGDFNTTEDVPQVYQLLINPANTKYISWIDSFRAVNLAKSEYESTKSKFNGNTKGSRIDFIFHTPGNVIVLEGAIERFNVAGRYPSDHYPVSATLRLD